MPHHPSSIGTSAQLEVSTLWSLAADFHRPQLEVAVLESSEADMKLRRGMGPVIAASGIRKRATSGNDGSISLGP